MPKLDVKVSSANLNYTVSIKGDQFSYQSKSRKVQEKIKPCASRAYELFANKMKSSVKKELSKTTIKSPNAIEVKMNKEKFYLSPLSNGGIVVSKVDTEIDYLISEAAYRCSKK